MSTSGLQSLLEVIHRATVMVLRQEPISTTEWQEFVLTVRTVYDFRAAEEEMYSTLKQDVSSTVELAKLKISSELDGRALVQAYTDEWHKFQTSCDHLEKAMFPLSARVLSKYDPNRGRVRSIMLNAWYTSIFSQVKHRVRRSVIQFIEEERKGKECESQLIIAVRKSYVDLSDVRFVEDDDYSFDIQYMLEMGEPYLNLTSLLNGNLSIYRELFKIDYVENTRAFYRLNAPERLAPNGVVSYMKYADSKVTEENARGEKYLQPDSAAQRVLTSYWGELFVITFAEEIVAQFSVMVKRNETENLSIMYRLMSLVPDKCTAMLVSLEAIIVEVRSVDAISEYFTKSVQQLLDLFNKFNKLIEMSFQNHPIALTSRDKAFKKIVNDTLKCAEFMANFCDTLLRKTQLRKKLTSGDVEIKLKDVVSLLKYVDSKDVFIIYYTSHLKMRLVLDTSADGKMEETMVVRMREIGMPCDYVFKLKQILRDVKNSQLRSQRCSTKVFCASTWARRSDKVSVSLPVELKCYVSEMEEFYSKQHSKRKLFWQHHLSTATISFANSVGNFDLDVTTFQMAVLFAWNERPDERVSLEDLRLATELPDVDVRKTIWSLVSMPMLRRGVVMCHPEVGSQSELRNDTRFWINDEFGLVRNGKVQKRGKINLIGRL